MSTVLRVCNPLQVLRSIVCLVPVLMVYLWKIVGVVKEGVGYQSMSKKSLVIDSMPQVPLLAGLSANKNLGWEYFTNEYFLPPSHDLPFPLKAAYPSFRRCLDEFWATGYFVPRFHGNHYT